MESLLLLGSTGFLGKSIVRELMPLGEIGQDLLISQNTNADDPLRLTRLGPDFKELEEFNLEGREGLPHANIVVVNCASSRYSQDEATSRLGNYEFPRRILDSLLRNENSRIHWVQFETFWQYSKSVLPDPTYVFWKNRFGSDLEEISHKTQVTYHKVVLPHLIGPDDNPNRFLPRTFLRLLRGEDVVLNSPEEIFHVTDARDVAKWLVSTTLNRENRLSNISELFPSHEMTLQEIVSRFASQFHSDSIITSVPDEKFTNPSLILADQPPMANLQIASLRTIDTTFADISQWLSGITQIDSL